MERVQTMNPFAKRESYGKRTLLIYRILTLFTWLLVVLLTIYYSFHAPRNGGTIWHQSEAHPSPFSLDPTIVSVYWTILLILQLTYIYYLSTFNTDLVHTAANVGSHFIVNNILQALFILLWVHSKFIIAEVALVLNFFNLTSLYFRHLKSPPFVHYPVVTGPLCFTFMAMLTNGAVALELNSIGAQVYAMFVVWWILFYGLFFVLAFKDCAVGWGMSVLLVALALEQSRLKLTRLHWIFTVVIAALLLFVTLLVAILPLLRQLLRELMFFSQVRAVGIINDEERPLLDDD